MRGKTENGEGREGWRRGRHLQILATWMGWKDSFHQDHAPPPPPHPQPCSKVLRASKGRSGFVFQVERMNGLQGTLMSVCHWSHVSLHSGWEDGFPGFLEPGI